MKADDFAHEHGVLDARPKGKDLDRMTAMFQNGGRCINEANRDLHSLIPRYKDAGAIDGLWEALFGGSKDKGPLIGYVLCPGCIRQAAFNLRQAAEDLEHLVDEAEKHGKIEKTK